MGPFHWTVWLAVTFTYLFAIFPISFSDNHSLHHLLKQPEEMENMFWYVFGTFTNCFTFTGAHSWNKSQKVATRLLIGFLTPSLIPKSLISKRTFRLLLDFHHHHHSVLHGFHHRFCDHPCLPHNRGHCQAAGVRKVPSGHFRYCSPNVAMVRICFVVCCWDRGGWERWFWNSSDSYTERLFNKIEFLSNVESGLRNTTKAFFWPYAFLGSRAELDYIVRTNFTTRLNLHIHCLIVYSITKQACF